MTTDDSFDPVKFDCPFCGREVRVVDDANKAATLLDGTKLESKPAIMHRVPECRPFRKLEPMAYLESAHKAIRAAGPS
jgi:hypothetical protein